MNITMQDDGPCRKKLGIEIEVSEVDAYYEKVLREFLRNARIAGFRKGKAPRALVEKRYQKDLYKATLDELLPDTYEKAVEEQGLSVVSVLGMNEVSPLDPAGPYRFTITVEVTPQFELPAYNQLPLEGRSTGVAEDEIDQMIDRMLERNASYDEAEGRPVKRGDMVQVDFEATLDGQPLVEAVPEAKTLDHAKGFWLLADEHGFLPGVAEGLEGADIGETRQITVTFGDDFTVKQLAGKSPVYAMTVKGIREKRLPEVDEAFLEKCGVESEAVLREKLRAEMEDSASKMETQRLKNEAARIMLERTQLEVPPSEVQAASDKLIREIVQEQKARGVKTEEVEAHKEEIFAQAQLTAVNQVKLNYIAAGIATMENIEVDNDEVAEHLASLAMRYRMSREDMEQMMAKHSVRKSIQESIRLNKVLELLVQRAEITASA